MRAIAFSAGLLLIAMALIDGFEAVLLPRRISHRFRYASLFYRVLWASWSTVGRRLKKPRRREAFLGIFGPLSLLGLLGTWVLALILGFALLDWSLGVALHAPQTSRSLTAYLYLSGTTFFTVGSEVVAGSPLARVLTVIEAGLGFGFLAGIIAYLPVFYQAFSTREETISMLDARAGSPPSAGEFLVRQARSGEHAPAERIMGEWERWCAELLETYISFPLLSYYRSQHDNQSWLAALTAILDTCALVVADVKRPGQYQAQLTFAIARHAAVDLCLVMRLAPQAPSEDRLPGPDLVLLRARLLHAGVAMGDAADFEARLRDLRGLYEPFVTALARRFMLALPPIVTHGEVADNWQRSAYMPRPPGIGRLAEGTGDGDDHFTS